MKYNDIEILAPVGSYESLAASIQGGANSVYFGIGHLNMRSRSSVNFKINDLSKISKICQEKNIKSYLALNTIMYDKDLTLMKKIVNSAIKSGINAIIVSDQSILNYTIDKPIHVHLSTQLNISNFETLKFYSKYSDVAVLARELNLNQIKQIGNQIKRTELHGKSGQPYKIEVFVHGALCMAVSGKCFLSHHIDNASANRGECYQVCRREFKVVDDQKNEIVLHNNYILSPKDLATLPFIDKIINSNVKILKIEGRGRSPEYVKTVVNVYRQAIDAINANCFTLEVKQNLMNKLATVYNRGFWSGHYLGENLDNWQTNAGGSKSNNYKFYVGKIKKYFKKINVAEALIEAGELSIGDEILIIGPTTGIEEFIVENLVYENKDVIRVTKGNTITFKINRLLRPSDKIYKLKKR